jgi:hypothetical protein
LWREFEAACERLRDEDQRDLYVAWHIAFFQRQERLPNLDRVIDIGTARSQRAQPIDEQRLMLQILYDVYGGTLSVGNV